MPREKLNQALDALHEQLASGAVLDDADRRHLSEVLNEIQVALDESTPHSPLVDCVTETCQRLESEHPTLTAGLREVIRLPKQL